MSLLHAFNCPLIAPLAIHRGGAALEKRQGHVAIRRPRRIYARPVILVLQIAWNAIMRYVRKRVDRSANITSSKFYDSNQSNTLNVIACSCNLSFLKYCNLYVYLYLLSRTTTCNNSNYFLIHSTTFLTSRITNFQHRSYFSISPKFLPIHLLYWFQRLRLLFLCHYKDRWSRQRILPERSDRSTTVIFTPRYHAYGTWPDASRRRIKGNLTETSTWLINIPGEHAFLADSRSRQYILINDYAVNIVYRCRKSAGGYNIRFRSQGSRGCDIVRGPVSESRQAQVAPVDNSSPRNRNTWNSVINFVWGPDGALATPSCVSAGVGPSCLALGTPLRQWTPAVPDVSDDVSEPPSWHACPPFYCYRDVRNPSRHFVFVASRSGSPRFFVSACETGTVTDRKTFRQIRNFRKQLRVNNFRDS